ncbi:MAG: hypothetical protein H6733_09965 [Alphaproteobacteria bacterium]|nr:hypothetical protein [Alphaproteobacteria bacterium]
MVFTGHALPQPPLRDPIAAGDALVLRYPDRADVTVWVLAGPNDPRVPEALLLVAVDAQGRVLTAPRWYEEVERGPFARAAAAPMPADLPTPSDAEDAPRLVDTLELEVAHALGFDLSPYVLDVLEDEEESPDELHDLFFDVVPWEAFEAVVQRLLTTGRARLDDGVLVGR